jgi:hypothetical protein
LEVPEIIRTSRDARIALMVVEEGENVPDYGPADLDVACLAGDQLRAVGLESAESVRAGLVTTGILGAITGMRNTRRMNRLFKKADREGNPLDDFFLFTPYLWRALAFMCGTRGVVDWAHGQARGAIALTYRSWIDLVSYYLDLDDNKPTKGERETILKVAGECFRDGASVFYEDSSDDDELTFCIRWS